jgi:hypothetical protein
MVKTRKRLSDFEAEKLGFDIMPKDACGRNHRYGLDSKQLKILKDLREFSKSDFDWSQLNNAKYLSEKLNTNILVKKENKGDSKNRYRMNDFTARKIGIVPNKSMRYRLTKEQKEKYFNLNMEKPIKRLFFDIETSPMIVYSWRVGYNINLPYENVIEDWRVICISYKWEHENKVKNLTWDSDLNDKQMLIDFIKIANTADEIVAHNGDRFDIKKVRTRCIFHRIPMFPKYRSLDTLKKARGSFSFPNNKLDTIAHYLGVGAKLKHDGFPMWVNCMKGDEKALKDMVKYCDMDIVVLEDVFLTMQNYIKPETHAGVHNGNLKYSCPVCGNGHKITLLKNDVTEKGTISRVMECNNCGQVYNISNSSYKNYLMNL